MRKIIIELKKEEVGKQRKEKGEKELIIKKEKPVSNAVKKVVIASKKKARSIPGGTGGTGPRKKG